MAGKASLLTILLGVVLSVAVVRCSVIHAAGLEVLGLRCEYRANPLGIDELHPRLIWRLNSAENGQFQSAYQILIATSEESLRNDEGDLWDSGKVTSSESVNISYDGAPLRSRCACFWKVRVWDRHDAVSQWSKSALWTMGLLNNSQWTAEYISYRDESPVFANREELFLPPARQYRKEFSIDKAVRRATVFTTALGIYELHLNGNRVGDALFAPGWTDYHQRAYYQTYDVTRLLKQDTNAIGTWVAGGWYSGYVGFGLQAGLGTEQVGRYTYGKTPSVMVQLEIEYEDGSRVTVNSDDTWRVTGEGPIREADLLMGETFDATKITEGWTEVGFDDSDWEHAIRADENGDPEANFYEYNNPNKQEEQPQNRARPIHLGFKRPRLQAFPGVPVRRIQEIPCVDVIDRGEDTYIFDLGQNIAGVAKLKITGPQGHRVHLRFGEMLHPDGRLMTENLRKARAQDCYVCKGDPAGEVYTPRFTFHGFQYVEVSNFPGEPQKDTITGLVVHSDTPLASSFECSDPTINQLYKNIVWTQRANFIDVPTDCPQRDERMGWTGDAQVYVASATLNADVSAFFTKWLRELMESQRPSGAFPGYAPFPFQSGWEFGTAWADAGVICPWTIWRAYGDTRVIEQCWEPMTKFMQWRQRTSQNYLGIDHGNNWGDWLSQGEKTPLHFIDSVYFAVSTRLMAEMADAIGHTEDAEMYRKLQANIQRAFAKKYIQSPDRLTVDTQTAYALAFYGQLIPASQRASLSARLATKIRDNGNRMSTGFLGTYSLLPALSTTGHHDLATLLLQSHEFPSWGYEVDQGATTIWERWDSYTKEDGFGRHNAEMNSFSHYAFGSVCQWMFENLAGIQTQDPGYHHIILRPLPPSPESNPQHEPIHWVKASYDSIRGRIESSWRLEEDRFVLQATIPTNTKATIYLPAQNLESVRVNGESIGQAACVTLTKESEGVVVLDVQSGKYKFDSQWPEHLHALQAQ